MTWGEGSDAVGLSHVHCVKTAASILCGGHTVVTCHRVMQPDFQLMKPDVYKVLNICIQKESWKDSYVLLSQ